MGERILVVNPNSSASCTRGIADALACFAAPGLPRFEVIQPEGGPPAVVTWRDWFGVAEPLCRLAEREPAAAYIIACVSDPGGGAVRTVTRAPVFGPLRSAIAAALARADRFGIIAFADPSIARQRRTLAAMGAAGRIAGHIPLNLPMEVLTDPVAPRAALVEAACGVPVIEPCQAAAAPASQAVIAARAARIEAAA